MLAVALDSPVFAVSVLTSLTTLGLAISLTLPCGVTSFNAACALPCGVTSFNAACALPCALRSFANGAYPAAFAESILS